MEEFGTEETKSVEFFTHQAVYSGADSSSITVRGRRFNRFIYSKIGEIDVLINQIKEPRPFCYQIPALLPSESMVSRRHFIEALSQYELTPNQRNIDADFIGICLTWNQIVSGIADSLDVSFFGSSNYIPIVVAADEAFCTTRIKRYENNWRHQRFREGIVQIPNTKCRCCRRVISDTPIEHLVRLHWCQHVFHKKCIYDWMWDGYNACPICSIQISLDLEYANGMF